MKTGKLFTIDVEIAEKLKNLNGSKLVNTLLMEYFEHRSGKNSLKEEKEAVFKALSKKKSKFLEKLRSLINGMDLAWIIFARHGLRQGLKVLQDLKSLNTSAAERLTFYLNRLSKDGFYIKNTERSYDD